LDDRSYAAFILERALGSRPGDFRPWMGLRFFAEIVALRSSSVAFAGEAKLIAQRSAPSLAVGIVVEKHSEDILKL
jgi:hypothetical protein